jgi:hypothetical protein
MNRNLKLVCDNTNKPNIITTFGEDFMIASPSAYSDLVEQTVREAVKGGKDKFDTYKLATLLLDLESNLLKAGIDEEQAATICDVACEEVVMKLQTIN